jgi:hypothetical protein
VILTENSIEPLIQETEMSVLLSCSRKDQQNGAAVATPRAPLLRMHGILEASSAPLLDKLPQFEIVSTPTDRL